MHSLIYIIAPGTAMVLQAIDCVITEMETPEAVSGRHGSLAYWCNHGLREPPNEDALYVNPGADIFAVVDGIGGYEGGETAARILAEACQAMAHKVGQLNKLSAEAVQHDAHLAMKYAGLGEGGACYVLFQLSGNELRVASAGDVKLVVLSEQGNVIFHTDQHRSGQYITNAVTGNAAGRTDYRQLAHAGGFRVIAASDGLWDVVSVPLAAAAVEGKEPLEALIALKELALEQQRVLGMKDNITVLLYDAGKAAEEGHIYNIPPRHQEKEAA